jgi:hypothetical protein
MLRPIRASVLAFLDALMDRLTITNTTLAEFQSSVTLLFFAVIFLNPWPTLSRLPVYGSMLYLMPEWGWGVTCLVLGAMQGVVHALRYMTGRIIAAFCSCAFYGFLSVLLAMASSNVPDSPFFGVPTYPVIPCLAVSSLVQAFVYLRLSLRQDAREREGARLASG